MSILSSSWSDISREDTVPVRSINLSASVLLPWSICAIMEKLRMWERLNSSSLFPPAGAEICDYVLTLL